MYVMNCLHGQLTRPISDSFNAVMYADNMHTYDALSILPINASYMVIKR